VSPLCRGKNSTALHLIDPQECLENRVEWAFNERELAFYAREVAKETMR